MKRINFRNIIEQFRNNKFFSFLSIFGVSIPIMIIMIMVLKVELGIHPGGAEKNNDEMLFLTQMKIKEKDGYVSMGGVHIGIITRYFENLDLPGALAYSSTSAKTFFNQRDAVDLSIRYTNADFWSVFSFDILEGRFYNESDISETRNVVVISDQLRRKLLLDHAVGKTLELDGTTYRIIGVIEDVSSVGRNTYAQVWMPYTLRHNPEFNLNETGTFSVTFEAKDKSAAHTIKNEIRGVRSKLNNMSGENKEIIFGGPAGPAETYFRGYRDPESYEGTLTNYLSIAGKMLLILFLPALNLVSLNLTRIQERSQEIAVRKAFGATKKNLAIQIILENSILTLLGGIIGLLMAYGLAFGFKGQIFTEYFIVNSQHVNIHMNFVVFFIVLFVSLVFSLLSGLIPALRMSKLQPAQVLKGGKR